jgi:uncharacterized membrane protein
MSRATRSFGPFFVVAGALHFVIPRTYESILPDALPAKRALVYASGLAERLPLQGLAIAWARAARR